MSFNPQIPDWGKSFSDNNLEKLLSYHNWLKDTGIKTGLISSKSDQFIWDEFIVHSLYFYKIILDLNTSLTNVYDLGTGAGIPGIPYGIVSDNKVQLVDIKQTRIFELERFLNTNELPNITALKADAELFIKNQDNSIFLMRCYIPKDDLIEKLKKHMFTNKNNLFIISSKSDSKELNKDLFHVKQQKFLINQDEYRFIDVITVK
ncbi:class I SAM-dependent methyltransferase [Candidatus Actinomarina]|jgi:16S rRNA G527 N7-methylase RsmG|nr:class I SAM-dependent methyltransferase [Candidatus Actinomarina sp.]MDC1071032.1 class I SAM-dependent methyltransferase [Acidimicrobiia bacterium]|tara:strand:- start:8566 stop:9180 length:615 start_codon:yes stop_codon:yes gene_type:complete